MFKNVQVARARRGGNKEEPVITEHDKVILQIRFYRPTERRKCWRKDRVSRWREGHVRVLTQKKAKGLTYSSLAHYVWTCEGRKRRNEHRNVNVCGDKIKSHPSLPETATAATREIICEIIR